MREFGKSFNMSRRGLLQAGAVIGLSAAAGSFAAPARAQTPAKGGQLRMGLDGGASADNLDPALATATVAFVIAHCWGDTLVESDPQDGRRPSVARQILDAVGRRLGVWTFKIRNDVTFHDGKQMTVADVIATLKRHADEGSQSGALGLMSVDQEHRGKGRRPRGDADGRQCRPAADLHRLPPDHPAERRRRQPDGRRSAPAPTS